MGKLVQCPWSFVTVHLKLPVLTCEFVMGAYYT